jgi:acyl-coenzyme A synthetase/AMP-(fatty) acid ligase
VVGSAISITRQVFFAPALPRNALGKVQKHLLREELDRKARPSAG